MPPSPLPRTFYQRPTIEVARDLLGMHLCHYLPDGRVLSGRIVEVEAYNGPEDKASHARLRKIAGQKRGPTQRSALMFGQGGMAYVYLIYGMHHCFNAVAHAEGAVGAVLVRALEPDVGVGDCRGPARLCTALEIDRRHNGLDLCPAGAPELMPELTPELTIEDRGTPVPDAAIAATPRIGVDYAGADAALPYRLVDRTSRHLSRKL